MFPNFRPHPDLKTYILCNGLKSADKTKWDDTLKKLKDSTKDEDERNSLLTVMGCSHNEDILKNFLIQSFDKQSPISFEYAVQAIVANHAKSVKLVLDILEDKYEQIKMM